MDMQFACHIDTVSEGMMRMRPSHSRGTVATAVATKLAPAIPGSNYERLLNAADREILS